MQLTEEKILSLLNFDTNTKQVFTAYQRVQLHNLIAICRDNRRHPELDQNLKTKVWATMKLMREMDWEKVIIRIGQDRLPYITIESKI